MKGQLFFVEQNRNVADVRLARKARKSHNR